MPNRDQKIIVMTGATSGFRRVAATEFASKGATLGIIARDPVKAVSLRSQTYREP
jgi:NADP-dependent 3-hydroxy acid dehydrogenase YdfG